MIKAPLTDPNPTGKSPKSPVESPPTSAVATATAARVPFGPGRYQVPLDVTETEGVFMMMMRAGRALGEKIEAAVTNSGESIISYRPLAIIVRFGPQTQQEIATLTAQHPAGVSRILADLEDRKLVRRVRGSHDRRTVRVEPTEEGRLLYERINPRVLEALESALKPLSPEDRKAFLHALEGIVAVNES